MATAYDLTSVQDVYNITGIGFRHTGAFYGPRAGRALTTTHVGTINNTVTLFYVPKGFVITGMHLDSTQLDSSTGLLVSVGDSGSATRLLSGSSFPRAAAVINVLPVGVLGYQYTADTAIVLTMTAAATTPVAGTFICLLEGWLDTDH